MTEETPRDRLLHLLRREAVLRGDFVLSSGQRSTFYLDARRVTLSSHGAPLVATVFLETFGDERVDAVVGLTLGADPIVSAIATLAGMAGRQVDGLIVRKAAKDHGTGRRIEGPWRPGMTVVVVEDTMTTGASALEAASAVEQAGGAVLGVVGLIDREEGARPGIEAKGYSFHAIFTASQILAEVETSPQWPPDYLPE